MAARRRQSFTPEVALARRVAEKRDRNDLGGGRTDLVCARYFEVITGIAHSVMPYSSADAQDAVSITFERLLREWARAKAYRAPVAVVVHTVARWESRGVSIKRYRQHESTVSVDRIAEFPAPDAFRELEAIDWMESIFAHLPARDRQVMEMRYLDEMPPAHIAEYLGIKANAVHQAQARAVRALRLIESA